MQTDDKDATASNGSSSTEQQTPPQEQQQESTNVTNAFNLANNESQSNRRQLNEYEKSVTDKENALIHTFSNLIENNLLPTQQTNIHVIHENNFHNNMKTNGKLIDFDLMGNDHQNDAIKTPISNGNGHTHINNFDNKM